MASLLLILLLSVGETVLACLPIIQLGNVWLTVLALKDSMLIVQQAHVCQYAQLATQAIVNNGYAQPHALLL